MWEPYQPPGEEPAEPTEPSGPTGPTGPTGPAPQWAAPPQPIVAGGTRSGSGAGILVALVASLAFVGITH